MNFEINKERYAEAVRSAYRNQRNNSYAHYIFSSTSLAEFGIPQSETERLALHCTRNKSISVKSYIPLGYEEIKAIFDLCY